jgi:hypothetical protein
MGGTSKFAASILLHHKFELLYALALILNIRIRLRHYLPKESIECQKYLTGGEHWRMDAKNEAGGEEKTVRVKVRHICI